MITKVKCLSVGRPAQYERALLVHFDARPTDKELLKVHSLLSNIESAEKMAERIVELQCGLAWAKHEAISAQSDLKMFCDFFDLPFYKLIPKLIAMRCERYFRGKGFA